MDVVNVDDPYTNYIKAYATEGVNADAKKDGSATVKYGPKILDTNDVYVPGVTVKETFLRLSDITDDRAHDTSGVLANRVSYPYGNGIFPFNHDYNALDLKARHYAGLFATTNLGAPLTDGSADGIWDARFIMTFSTAGGTGRAIVDGGVNPARWQRVNIRNAQADIDENTTMFVNFANKSITTRTQDPVNLESYGKVTINGHFTPEGVIYGDSSWVFDGQVSNGSVSGLIGSAGAVGAFISNGANNGENSYGEYSGGFVAAPR